MRGYKSFGSNPHPGYLRHRVKIGYTVNTVNANGYPVAEDIILCTPWAGVTDAGNQEYRAADAQNSEAVINFTIRYRGDVRPGMWVLFQNKKWDISTIGQFDYKRSYLGLKASIAEGVSG